MANTEEKQSLVLVAEDQLSLAIGKEGQNVRLAARLTGWKIDIKDINLYDEEAEMAKWAAQAQAAAAEPEEIETTTKETNIEPEVEIEPRELTTKTTSPEAELEIEAEAETSEVSKEQPETLTE